MTSLSDPNPKINKIRPSTEDWSIRGIFNAALDQDEAEYFVVDLGLTDTGSRFVVRSRSLDRIVDEFPSRRAAVRCADQYNQIGTHKP